jgi:predicted phosphoadenosine phosphosulfate sulfurtransferase
MEVKIKYWVRLWVNRCYKGGLPDESPSEIYDKVPSYERIAKAILSNDHQLKSLGFTTKQSKYYGMLKRIELKKRGVIKKSNQLNLFSYDNIKR